VLRGRVSLAGALLLLATWGQGRTPSAVAPSSPPPAALSAFSSPRSCAALQQSQQRLPRAPGVARFASWNLHWFPDGGPGQREHGADLSWLACAIWWLDADVVAVQEVKDSPRARQAMTSLLAELNRASGARYVIRLDDCGARVPQHVGLIWNEARVKARDIETVARLNPAGGACERQLRPGLAARLQFPGGLDLTAVSVHFKSMTDARGYALRARSFAEIPGVARAVTERTRDSDFLLLGDLNTMGCTTCSPATTAQQEISGVERQLVSAGLRLVPADAAGSQLYAGGVSLLDHAVASSAMRELGPQARSRVVGACAEAEAPTRRAAKKLRRALSDHCPIVLDLTDRDFD
jgi:endonuclease/exonuclease/phosphatase family metal-dependent hydrolase